MLFNASTRQPLGLGIAQPEKVRVMARGGNIALGDVVFFDLAGVDAATVDVLTSGGATDNLSTVTQAVLADTVSLTSGLYAVALEAITDDTEGWVAIRGSVDIMAGAVIAIGAPVAMDATSGRCATAAAGHVIFGYAQEAGADGSLCRCIFDGINHFGTNHA